MKKIFTTFVSLLFPFVFAVPAFAQNGSNVNLCAGTESSFSPLCNLAGGNAGKLVAPIISILFIVVVILCLFFLIWGGIKWVLSEGDKTKVEAARNHIVAAIVGLIVAFAAYFILSLIVKIFLPDFQLNNIRIPSITAQ